VLKNCGNLKKLNLSGCALLKRPDLSQGPTLRRVWLGGSGIEELEVGQANRNLSMLEFDTCENLTRIKLTGLRCLGPDLVINSCNLLKEVEISRTEQLERLTIKSCAKLEAVQVHGTSDKFRWVYFSDLPLPSVALQEFVDRALTVTELHINDFKQLISLKLAVPSGHKLNTLNISGSGRLRKVCVTGSSVASIMLQDNSSLRCIDLDCENLERLWPEDLFGLGSDGESQKVVEQRDNGIETIRLRSSKLTVLRIANSTVSPSMRDFEVKCDALKRVVVRNCDLDNSTLEVLSGKELEVARLVNVTLPKKQAFRSPHLEILTCCLAAEPEGGESRGEAPGQLESRKQKFSVGYSSPREIELASGRLRLLFLTKLAHLSRLTFLADRLPFLEWVDLTGSFELEDEGVIELATRCNSLRKLVLRGCITLTDQVGPVLSNLKETLKILDLSEARLKNVELHLDELEHLDLSECTRLRDCTLDCGKLQGLVVNGVSGDVRSMLGKLRSSKLRFVWLQRARQ
jgi:hypothetical protein